MRHRKKTAKLGRKSEHRNMMLANMVCCLIKERRITTTLAKARAVRPVAEKMVTLGKKGSLHNRRVAASRLRQEDAVRILFNEIAPLQKDRPGGYTRIIRMHQRRGDAAQLAILEWVDAPLETSGEVTAPAPVAEPTPEPAAPVKEVASEATPAEETPAEEPKAAETKTEPAAETKAEPAAEAKAEAGEEKKDDEKK